MKVQILLWKWIICRLFACWWGSNLGNNILVVASFQMSRKNRSEKIWISSSWLAGLVQQNIFCDIKVHSPLDWDQLGSNSSSSLFTKIWDVETETVGLGWAGPDSFTWWSVQWPLEQFPYNILELPDCQTGSFIVRTDKNRLWFPTISYFKTVIPGSKKTYCLTFNSNKDFVQYDLRFRALTSFR